jgi:hypothetical protein
MRLKYVLYDWVGKILVETNSIVSPLQSNADLRRLLPS